MEVQAISKSVRISPRKMRLVADAIRHLSINEALDVLDSLHKRAALPLTKTLNSAIANAVNNAKLDRNNLVIGSIQISDGQVLKRFRPSTRGRIHPYKKRGSNIHVVLKTVAAPVVAKPVVKADEKKSAALPSGAVDKKVTKEAKAAANATVAVEKTEKKKSILEKAMSVGKRGKK